MRYNYAFNFRTFVINKNLSRLFSLRNLRNFLLLATFLSKDLFASTSFEWIARWDWRRLISEVKIAICTSGDPLSLSCLIKGLITSAIVSSIDNNKKNKKYQAISRCYSCRYFIYTSILVFSKIRDFKSLL